MQNNITANVTVVLACLLLPPCAHSAESICRDSPNSPFKFSPRESASDWLASMEKLEIADHLLNSGDYLGAIDEAKSASTTLGIANCLDDSLQLHSNLLDARLMLFEDKFIEASSLLGMLIPSVERIFGTLSNETVTAKMRLANARLQLGETKEGLVELLAVQWLLRQRAAPPNELLSEVTRSIGVALALDGEELQAKDLAEEGLELTFDLGGHYSFETANFDELLASIFLRRGDLPGALRIQSRALLFRLNHSSPTNLATLTSLWKFGYLLNSLGRLESANQIFEYILASVEQLPSAPYRRLELQSISRLGNIAIKNNHIAEAKLLFQRSYEGSLKSLGLHSEDTLVEAANFADAMVRAGDSQNGCRLLNLAQKAQLETQSQNSWVADYLEIKSIDCRVSYETLGSTDGNQNTQRMNESWRRIRSRFGGSSLHAMLALGYLADLEIRTSRRLEAKDHLTQLLIDRGEPMNSHGNSVLGAEDLNKAWISNRTSGGRHVAGVRDLALLHAEDGEIEDALRVSELARDRSLQDRFARESWRSRELPASARAKLEAPRARLQALDEKIAIATDVVDRVRIESERVIAGADLAARERDVGRETGIPLRWLSPPGLDRLRASVAPGTALVSILHSTDRWWALVLSPGAAPRFVPFAGADLGVLAHAWKKLLRGDPVRVWPGAEGRYLEGFERPGNATGPHLTPAEIVARLGDALAAPLVAASEGARKWVVVADDELVGLPLQALPWRGGYLGGIREIVYAPSFTTWLHARERAGDAPRRMDLLALGLVGGRDPEESLADLPWSGKELEAIRAQFPKDRVRAWLGPAANKAALLGASREGRLAHFRYVHFASHAWAISDPPEASAIALSALAPGVGGKKAALTAAELAGLSMNADLLVLSACDTGAGRYEHGRGLLGLAHASLAAGNRAALLSLWPVADDRAAQFMGRFYALLREGDEPSLALARVQREWVASGDAGKADPSAWAAFVLWGGA